MIKSYPLNCFRENNFVDIVGVPAMKNLRIDKINDSGVYVYSHIDGGFMLSGASPAVYTSEAPPDPTLNFNSVENIKARRARRSNIKGKVNAIKIPKGKFTVAQLAELNDIPYVNAKKWIDENCFACGKAPKVPGTRGKSANLYVVNN
jgi:hypothetical protein